MTRRIVFYGNCQARALADLYRARIAPTLDQQVDGTGHDRPDRALLVRADAVVEQVFSGHPLIDPGILKPGVRHIRFPLMMAQFLWPYSGQPHVRNQSHPYLSAGPYPEEMGDSFLNGMIGKVPEAEAAQRYRHLDVARHAGLDRLFELHMEAQRTRDRIAGFDTADLIAARFRTEALFSTRGHPGAFLMAHIARHVFAALDVPDRMIDVALSNDRFLPFGAEELPIHPNVAAHFRLRHADASTRYHYKNEGFFTFDQYVQRYLRYEWNPDLHEGIQLALGPDAARGKALLEQAVQVSPDSGAGHHMLAHLYLREGDMARAHQAAQRAIIADARCPDHHALLGAVMVAQGDLLAAETAFRTAMALLPGSVRFHAPLVQALMLHGRVREAATVLSETIDCGRPDARLFGRLGWALRDLPDLPAAEVMFRHAIDLEPGFDNHRIGLVATLNALGREDESLALLRTMAEAGSHDPETYVYMAHMLRARDDLDGAEAAFAKALICTDDWPELHEELARVRAEKQRRGARAVP